MNKFLLFVSLVALFDLAGSMLAKMWVIKSQPTYLIGTVLSFAATGFFFAKSLKFKELAIANIIWIALSIVIVAIAGYFLFNEKLSLIQILGMLIIIIGIVLVNAK